MASKSPRRKFQSGPLRVTRASSSEGRPRGRDGFRTAGGIVCGVDGSCGFSLRVVKPFRSDIRGRRRILDRWGEAGLGCRQFYGDDGSDVLAVRDCETEWARRAAARVIVRELRIRRGRCESSGEPLQVIGCARDRRFRSSVRRDACGELRGEKNSREHAGELRADQRMGADAMGLGSVTILTDLPRRESR